MTIVPPTTQLVSASHATKDTISLMELANSLPSTLPSLLTQDVLIGTGTTKSAWLAPKTGSSMPIKSVFLFQTNVLLMMLPDFA